MLLLLLLLLLPPPPLLLLPPPPLLLLARQCVAFMYVETLYWLQGTVINIEPTRTILRDTTNRCIVHLANSEVGGCWRSALCRRTPCLPFWRPVRAGRAAPGLFSRAAGSRWCHARHPTCVSIVSTLRR